MKGLDDFAWNVPFRKISDLIQLLGGKEGTIFGHLVPFANGIFDTHQPTFLKMFLTRLATRHVVAHHPQARPPQGYVILLHLFQQFLG